ncbi:MAG: hypothetical protein JXB23_18625, partial [Candidatus Aminicenantes bacterium]|nr:hypothetical protein [Candidatus Aminicenantes bacterium]
MNFRKWTIGKKILAGFISVALLAVIVGAVTYSGITKTVNLSEEAIRANELLAALNGVKLNHLTFVNRISTLLRKPDTPPDALRQALED